MSIIDAYTDQVCPRVFDQLDQVFPDYGFRQDANGWHATNREATKRLSASPRPDRVVCHTRNNQSPRGILIHDGPGGGIPIPFAALVLNQESMPRGIHFVDAVKELAQRVGVEISDKPHPDQKRWDALNAYATITRNYLLDSPDSPASIVLQQRGLDKHHTANTSLGAHPPNATLRTLLEQDKITSKDALDAGIPLSDDRWNERLVGVWRDRDNNARTCWGRATGDQKGPKYLYLKGQRSNFEPYGFSSIYHDNPKLDSVILVEGQIDAHQLQQAGYPACAIGGATTTNWVLERLGKLDITTIILLPDQDNAGYMGAQTTIDRAYQTPNTIPRLYVAEPDESLDEAGKDADEMIRNGNLAGLDAAIQNPIRAIQWRFEQLGLRQYNDLNNLTSEQQDNLIEECVDWALKTNTIHAISVDRGFQWVAETCNASHSALATRLFQPATKTLQQAMKKPITKP
jgi:DNA primase